MNKHVLPKSVVYWKPGTDRHERVRYDSRSNVSPSESYLIIHKNCLILFLMKDALKMMYGF